MSGSREPVSAETDKWVLYSLSNANIDLTSQSAFEKFGIEAAERGRDIVFIDWNLSSPSIVQLAAELANRDGSLLVGLVPGTDLSRNWNAAENLRLMLHFCDTVIMANSVEIPDNVGLAQRLPEVISEICEGLANTSGHRFLRRMLKRGQLARVSSARSCSGNVEEAILKVLRAILPVAEFTQHPDVFLNISSRNEIDRKTLTRASKWISKSLTPANAIICSNCKEAAQASVCLLVTGIAFPYSSSSSRNLSIDIDDLEPESSIDNEMMITLELDQIE